MLQMNVWASQENAKEDDKGAGPSDTDSKNKDAANYSKCHAKILKESWGSIGLSTPVREAQILL